MLSEHLARAVVAERTAAADRAATIRRWTAQAEAPTNQNRPIRRRAIRIGRRLRRRPPLLTAASAS